MPSRRSLASGFFLAALGLTVVAVDTPTGVAVGQEKKAEVPPGPDADLVRTAQALYKDLRSETLPNGLRVFLLPVKGSPVVSTMVAYRVGSGDEDKDQTGLSHYLEHLLFKGTDKLMPGDIDRATQRNGGANNAYTNEDMTVYHFDFAADRWEAALEIEADRMRNVRIDAKHEFEQEKGAVIAELARNEDRPFDLELKAILPLLYPKDAPYSHPVIGEEKHVRSATAEIIKRHYDKWYYPNNASLVVVGGFDPDAALAKIKALFGPIPKGDLPPRRQATEFKDRQGPVRKEFDSKFDLPRMVMGFNTIPLGDPDKPVLDFIDRILSDGRTSRLYRKMVEDERVCIDIGTYESNDSGTGRHPGWFGVFAEVLKGKDRKKVEDLVFVEMEKLAAEPVTDAELARARRKLLARFVFSRESVHSLADSIAQISTYPALGDDPARYYAEYTNRVLAVTKSDIQRVAKTYFSRKQAAIVWSIPKDDGKKDDAKKGAIHGGGDRSVLSGLNRAGRQERFPDGPGKGGFSLTAAKRVVLPNGLTLIMLEDHRIPVVVARAAIRDTQLREPEEKAGVALLTGSLLEEGTTTRTGQEIAALIEDTGGSLGLSSSGGSLKVLTPDTDLGLNLLFDCLTRPKFPQDAFDRQKEQQLATIEDSETQPRERAEMLFDATIYGKHPFSRPAFGRKETVAKLTPADCAAYHKSVFVPNNAIVVVAGDFKPEEMAKKVEALTKDWRKADLPALAPPAAPKPVGGESIVSDPNAAQVHVFIGHLGVTRTNPDYYKLLVLDNVLGTGPGFTDRLSSTLRDRQGLAYTVNASITSTATNQPGAFQGYIGTFPKSFVDVRAGFLKEVNRIRDEPPTPQEVEDAKKYLLGSLPFRFTTLNGVAGQLMAAEQYGLGFDFLEKYQKEVAAVTPADVQAMAKKYLDPKALTVVAVGAIDKDGKPLVKK
jgi:zinc protease